MVIYVIRPAGVLDSLNSRALDAHPLYARFLCSQEGTNLIPAVLALLAAGLGRGVRQAAAGRGGLSVSVPLFVSKPGEGHAGGDGGH